MNLVDMKGLTKRFGGITALKGVDFSVKAGETVGLLGENGAGKSTLMRILSGLEHPDEGEILIDGKPRTFIDPNHALRLGIGMIPQELILVDQMSVLQNLFLGREYRTSFGTLDRTAMTREARHVLKQLDCDHIDLGTQMFFIAKADQQLIAIARRILQGGRVFVMDEPTSALTEKETRHLFDVVHRLCADGSSVVFISHRLEEVMEICDRFLILRDGVMVADIPNTTELTKRELVKYMIGSDVADEFPHQACTPGPEVLQVRDLRFLNNQGRPIEGLSFSVHSGEILGITGLVGVGKSELAQTIVGLRSISQGEIRVDGVEQDISSPVAAVRAGIGYVTEDRRGEGLVFGMKSLYNMTLTALDKISRFLSIRRSREKNLGASYAEKFNMKPQYMQMPAGTLSGGNQQKVVLIRCLIGDSRVLVLDEPTKGIDVGAKAEIARLLNEFAIEGKGILIISSEPREVLGLSDRVLVMTGTGIHGPFSRGELDYAGLMEIEFGAAEGA